MRYVVVDLEMNEINKKSEARSICRNEVIEIGAVMLDEGMNEVGCFKTYVKPEYNGISNKISKLTGITDSMVLMAPRFSDAIKSFTRWCLEDEQEVEIYAWSGSDYGQIAKEIILKGYKPEAVEEKLLTIEWKDFQQEFDQYLGFEKKLSLKQALELAGIGFDGREHDALDDARNTADLMRTFRDEKLFELTLRRVKEALTPTDNSCTLGDFFNFFVSDCA